MTGERFLQPETLKILGLGVVALGIATAAGVLMAKLMNLVSRKNPINPLIGSAGVSAVPMAARVSPGRRTTSRFRQFLAHARDGAQMSREVIGTAVVAGFLIAKIGGG